MRLAKRVISQVNNLFLPAVAETPGSGYNSGAERAERWGKQQGEPKGLDSAKISKPCAQLWLNVWRKRQGEAQTKYDKGFESESKVSFWTFGTDDHNTVFSLVIWGTWLFFSFSWFSPTPRIYVRKNAAPVWRKGKTLDQYRWLLTASTGYGFLSWVKNAVSRRSFNACPSFQRSLVHEEVLGEARRVLYSLSLSLV